MHGYVWTFYIRKSKKFPDVRIHDGSVQRHKVHGSQSYLGEGAVSLSFDGLLNWSLKYRPRRLCFQMGFSNSSGFPRGLLDANLQEQIPKTNIDSFELSIHQDSFGTWCQKEVFYKSHMPQIHWFRRKDPIPWNTRVKVHTDSCWNSSLVSLVSLEIVDILGSMKLGQF